MRLSLLAVVGGLLQWTTSCAGQVQACDATAKSQLDDLLTAQRETFDTCAPGKKIWTALNDLTAPNFKSCICSAEIYTNLTAYVLRECVTLN